MKLNQKTIGFALLLIVTLLSMNIRSTQLGDRAIVEALGVDYSELGYTVTAQVYNPTADDNAKSQTKILSGSGDNIAQAIEDINRKNSKTLYLSHNSFIALGLECASMGIEEVLDFFQNEPQTRPDILMVLTDEAGELIKFTNDENTTPAKSVAEILNKNAQNGTLCDMRLYEILRLKETITSDFMMALVTNTDTSINPKGALVFKENSPAVLLTEDEMLGYNLIKGNVKDAFVSVNNKGVTIKNSYSRIQTNVMDETIEIRINIDVNVTINEEDITETLNELKEDLEEKVYDSVETALFQNGCDIFEFGKIIRKNHPKLLRYYKNWSNNQKITLFTAVECHIE